MTVRRMACAAASVLALALAAVGTALATAPAPASGSASFAPFPDYFELVRDTGKFTEWCTQGNPGSLTGTFTGSRVFIGCVHAFHDGRFKYEGTVLFTGTVAGCGSGTVILKVVGEGGPSDGTLRRDTEVAIGGTLGVQANLEMVGTLDSLPVAYTGKYAC